MGYKTKFRPKNTALLSIDILLDIADTIDDIRKGRGKDDVDFFCEDLKFLQESAKILAERLDKRRKECELRIDPSKRKFRIISPGS